MPAPVAFVLKGYPRLSETFIAQEILALERRGLDIRLISLRHPTDRHRHPIHDEIAAAVRYLPEYLYQEPLRVLAGWRGSRHLPGYRAALRQWWQDLKRDRTPNRIRRFGQALVLAHELDPDIGHLHAHFLHTPASVTRYAAIMRGLSWSCSAHAKDIWTTPEWEKREKLADLSWLTTCSQVACTHLEALAPEADKVMLAYHGLDLSRFPPHPKVQSPRDGTRADDPVRLISVGRAVTKKGYDDLIAALAMLPAELNWRFTHIGGGTLLKRLKAQAREAGIEARIDWLGARPQEDVLQQLREADLFVLASRIAGDGDRDGLPNVLMEAQSQGLACLATAVSAIPELIEDGKTGRLVPPGDRPDLAAALQQLVTAPELRRELGEAGQRRIVSRFGLEMWIDRLASRFGLAETPLARQAQR